MKGWVREGNSRSTKCYFILGQCTADWLRVKCKKRGLREGRCGWGNENVWRGRGGKENGWKDGRGGGKERMGEGGVRKGEGLKGRVIEELKERKEKEGIGGIGY